MRVLLIVCCLFSLVSLEEAPNLRQVTSDISIVSRITTGIFIQNELLENKITGNEVVANMIQIKSSKVLDDLKDVQTSETSTKLDEISTFLKPFGESTIQKPHYLRKNLQVLPEFLEEVELLESASQVALTEDFRAKAAAVTGGAIDLRASIVGQWPLLFISESLVYTLNDSLTEIPKENDDIFKMKAAILRFRRELKGYKEYVTKLKAYETELAKLIELEAINVVEVLEPVKKLKDLAVKYDQTILGGTRMIEWLKALKEEAEKVETSNILKNQELFDNLIKELDILFPLVKDLSTVRVGKKSTQLSLLFKNDLTTNFFSKNFAEGEEKYMEKLKKSLSFLETFSGKVELVTKGLEEFSSKYSEFEVFALKRIVSRIQEILKKMTEFDVASATIKTSLDASIKCFETNALTYSRKDVDLDEFEKTYKFSLNLHKRANQMHESMKQVLAITEIDNYAILDLLRAKISDEVNNLGFRMTETQAWDTMKAMREVPNVQEFITKFKKAANLLLEIDRTGLYRMLKETIDFNVISKTQEVLSDTNFIPLLRCLKDLKDPIFDSKDSLTLMNLLDKVRDLKEEDIQTTKEILEKMESIKRDLGDLETSSKRAKREAETEEKQLQKMENSKKTAEELENGVKSLDNLIEVLDQKDSIMAATNFENKVNDIVFYIRMPPMQSVWTPIVRQKMQRIFKEAEQLEKMADHYGKKELPNVFGVLDNATFVNGLELDTSLFKTLVPSMLAASTDSEIQSAAPVFEKLSSLDLNFAARHSALKTASQTLQPLRKFFDDFFGIDRSPKKQQINGTDAGTVGNGTGIGGAEELGMKQEDSSFFLLIIAGFLILCIVIFIIVFFCVRKRSQNKKLQDKETWRHLRFLSENAVTDKDGTKYTPLHLAVLKKKLDEVKKLVKSGAYVDVHCFGKMIETPLHTAVTNKSSEIVEFLIKHGADLNALDSNYETPLDRAKSSKDIQKMINGYKSKHYKKTLPQPLPVDKFKIYIDEKVKGKKEFCDRFKQNVVSKIEKSTHVVVKTGKDGTFELGKDDASLAYLGVICSHKILMSSDWLSASVQKQSNLRNDFKFRVKKIKYNGKTFKNIDDIQLGNSKMQIPYLTNTIIHFDQADLHTIDWNALRKIAIDLGSQNVDEFPVMQGMIPGKCPYYRQDLGHIFVIYSQSNAEKLTTMYPILKTDKAYTFLDRDEFVELLLAQKTVHKKMKKSESAEDSTGTTGTTGTTATTGTTGTTGTTDKSGSMEPADASGTPSATPFTTPLANPSATPSGTPSGTESATPTPSKTPLAEQNQQNQPNF